jgi:hypothetical protein
MINYDLNGLDKWRIRIRGHGPAVGVKFQYVIHLFGIEGMNKRLQIASLDFYFHHREMEQYDFPFVIVVGVYKQDVVADRIGQEIPAADAQARDMVFGPKSGIVGFAAGSDEGTRRADEAEDFFRQSDTLGQSRRDPVGFYEFYEVAHNYSLIFNQLAEALRVFHGRLLRNAFGLEDFIFHTLIAVRMCELTII